MNKQPWQALLAVAAVAMTAGSVNAATYAEIGDAGETLGTAAIADTQPGVSLDAIVGTLTANNADLFQIYISDPVTFSANTLFTTGVNNFDTSLFLFDAGGFGVYANDDATGSQSALPAGDALSPTTAGIYYIAISGSGFSPVSTDGPIFQQPNGNTIPFNAVLSPTGVGGTKALSGWTGTSGSNAGAYRINLTGATFVPEPTVSVFLPSLFALWGAASLKRRSRIKA
ncbi:MAG: DVUA0089 family protein [Anaerolineae bacterium]|nr:DVUA0089 family protein [Gloeobacterales cyanobacterium ES-bin-313]